MSDALQAILARADTEAAGLFTADEVATWPAGTVEGFVGLGILREAAPAKEVLCLECPEGCWIEPRIQDDPRTGKPVGVYLCRRNEEVGRFNVDLARRRRWEFDAAGAAAAVAAALKSSGPVQELRAGRLYFLGTVIADGHVRECFFGRGLAWRDAPAVLSSAEPLRGAAAPTVLVPARRPTLEAWPGRRAIVIPLLEVATLKRGKLKLDASAVFLGASEVGRGEKPEWVTVTDGAKLLMDDIPGLSLEHARARVSKAAGDNAFQTNGKKGKARRIEKHSFSTWRLAQRDKDLDAADW